MTTKKLTQKQDAFAKSIAHGMKQRAAATHAGFSAATADVTAAKLMKRADIQAAIARYRKEMPMPPAGEPEPGRLGTNFPDSLSLLRAVYNNEDISNSMRLSAAIAALPYEHAKLGEKGKKESKVDAAHAVANGDKKTPGRKPKFGTKTPPALKLVK